MNHKERSFGAASPSAYLLPEMDTHWRRGEVPKAWELDRELRQAAKAYRGKRYEGVPCDKEGHGRLRHTSNGRCCHCTKADRAYRAEKQAAVRQVRLQQRHPR